MDYADVPSRNSLSKASVRAAIEERAKPRPESKGIIREVMDKLKAGEKPNKGIRKKVDDADPGKAED